MPSINLAHVDLTGTQQCPEQHGCSVGRWQHGLRLDPPLELLVQPLDGIGGARAPPLTGRQPPEGEQPVAGFLQAIGDGAMLEPPFADEGFAPRLDLLAPCRVNHVVVVGGDLIVQPLWRMR